MNNNNMEHKFPRPGPLWRIPCQQDLQFVAAELVQVEGTLIFSVLALEVLNWLSHVNPNSIISLPRINSASSSFGEYTVGDCVTEAHTCTHTHTHVLWEQVSHCTAKSRPLLELLSRLWYLDEGFYPLQAFSYLLYASQNPRWWGRNWFWYSSVVRQDLPLTMLCFSSWKAVTGWSLTCYETFHVVEIAGPGWGD